MEARRSHAVLPNVTADHAFRLRSYGRQVGYESPYALQ